MKNLPRRLRFALLYSSYLIITLLAIDYFFFFRPYFQELRGFEDFSLEMIQDPDLEKMLTVRHVDHETMKLLGKVGGDKESFFVHFEKAKRPDDVRICAFGDSYTHGDEVDEAHDYPSILGRIFEQAGATNVETINFGVGGYGFHQTYMMWERVGQGFDCDVILLGPRGFQPIRDTTFGFIHHWSPYYLHARYVLADGGVRLVEVLGDTYGERFNRHFRFIPPWRYLRYDRKAPMFLKSLVPRDRTLPNPFYYDDRDMREEAYDTYRVLLEQLAATGKPIVLGHYDPSITELGAELETTHLRAVTFYEREAFPYIAAIAHASPWGNQLLARQHFAQLTGETSSALEVLETSDVEWATSPPLETKRAISSFSKIEVELEEKPIGRFTVPTYDAVRPLSTHSLVAVKSPEVSLLDAVFLPLDEELRPGMELTLEADGQRYALGELVLLDGRFNVGIVEVEGLEILRRQTLFFFRGNSRVQTRTIFSAAAVVSLGGQTVMRGTRGRSGIKEGFWLTPSTQHRVLRATEDALVAMDQLPEREGLLYLTFHHWQDGVTRAPIGRWRRGEVESPNPDLPADAVLTIGPEGRAKTR